MHTSCADGMRRYVGGVIFDGQRVLLGKRSKYRERYPGVWDIFGGHIALGETAYDALCREMHEELGVEVKKATHVGQLNGVEPLGTETFNMAVYLITQWTFRPHLTNIEHEEIRWFHPSQLDTLLSVVDARLPSFVRAVINQSC